MPKAALVSLATSVPPHVLLQKDVLAAAWDGFGARFPEFERFSSIFSNTGIIKRHAVKPFDWYFEPRGWPERTEAFLEGAEALFIDVAGKALASDIGLNAIYECHGQEIITCMQATCDAPRIAVGVPSIGRARRDKALHI